MGRLISRVREAEERLAGIARALQSAYEEELAEALQARDAALRGLASAQAMEHAARSLGRDELAERVGEVAEQFRLSEAAAQGRLQELAEVERAVQARLQETTGERTPSVPPPARLPERPSPRPPPPPPEARSEPVAPPPAAKPAAPKGEGPRAAAKSDLDKRLAQLEERLDELTRAAPRWPREIAREAVQEHVALARLLQERAGDEATVEIALERLRELAGSLDLKALVGLDPAERADWALLSSDARARRQALVAARKKSP